jgi:hypothetical protein
MTCSGSTTLNIASGVTTNVTVEVQCIAVHPEFQSDGGNALPPSCPAWGSVTATPSEVVVGRSLVVSATATAGDPTAIAYFWSAPSGTFDTPTAPTTIFSCTAPGQVPITLNLGNHSADSGDLLCAGPTSSTTITVQCDSAQTAPAPATPPWATLLLGAGLASLASAVVRKGRGSGAAG